ncbi:MAG: HD domain-containing phosphohydrolase [Syntrophomonadaceae bacterium]
MAADNTSPGTPSDPNHDDVNIERIIAVLEQINGLFCAYDIQGQFIFMTMKLRTLLGYQDQDITGFNIADLTVERQRKRVKEGIQSRTATKQEGSWEFSILSPSGQTFHVTANTSPLYQQHRVVGEIMLFEDITERKQAEGELRESRRQLADIIESLPDATAVVDRGGRILYWNRAMVEMTGYAAADMVGKGNHEYTVPFYGKRRAALLDYVLDPATNIDKEYSYIKREGDVWYIEAKTDQLKGREAYIWARATPLFNTRGEVVGAVETVRDITERKRAEEDLIRSHERLEAIFSGTVNALAVTTEKRDQYTAGHQHRVAALACGIAREMRLPDKTIDDIRIAGTLHDIGKLYVPLDILSQPGKLTDIEYLFIKTHPTAGYDILKSIPFDAPIAEIIMQHHERMDGSGYPRGLKEEEILLPARIIAVADVFEAMASHRPYRASLGVDRALDEIEKNAGRLYDRDVADACIRLVRKKDFEAIFEDK